jgi:tetratricopeptide (TPR) repeat protein
LPRKPDPLDALFAEDSSSLVSALFRGYISHSLLFYRQNDLQGFRELLRLGRELQLGPGESSGRRLPPLFEGGPGWAEAFEALWQNDESDAFRLLTQAIRRAPREASFHVLRGFVQGERYWGSRRLSPESIADFEKALSLDPNNLWAHMGLGMALEMRRRYVRARAHFEAASRLAPRWSWPHVFRGVCLWYQAEFKLSIKAFAVAAKLDPKGDLPLLFSARAQADLRDRSLVRDLDKALKLSPGSGFALSWRGRAMFVLTRLPEALGDLRRACRLLPDYDRGWSWLGVSLIEQGKLKRAVPLLEKARKLNPHYPTTLYPLAGALMKMGRWKEAGRVMKEAAFIDRSGVWIEHRISMSHPNPAALRSRADLERFLARAPKSAWAWAWKGQTELLLQNYRGALEGLTRAIALDARDPWARVWRGETLRRLGEWDAALADFDAALRLDATLSWPYAGRGDCLLALGRTSAALASLDRSLSLQSFCGPAYALRGRALLALGRTQDARSAFATALELHPQDIWIHNLLKPRPRTDPAASFETRRLVVDARELGLKDCAEALSRGDASRALAACMNDRRESRLYRLRGWLKLHCGDAAGAAEDASRALDATLDPADPAALWLRARARAVLGELAVEPRAQRGLVRA